MLPFVTVDIFTTAHAVCTSHRASAEFTVNFTRAAACSGEAQRNKEKEWKEQSSLNLSVLKKMKQSNRIPTLSD